MDWERLHRLADVIAILTLPAAITGASILEWARRMPRFRQAAGWSFIGAAVIFYAIDIADRFNLFAPPRPVDIAINWGATGQGTFWITADERPVEQYKDNYKLILILNVPISNVDKMTDTNISKSSLYTITGDASEMFSAPLTQNLGNGLPPGQYMVVLTLALVPTGFSAEKITSLGDVPRFGGRFVGARGVNGLNRVLVPSTSPTSPTSPTR
jgi:hypothetical protein